jgi:hypothetical protein
MKGFSKEQILSAVQQGMFEASAATQKFLATHGDRDACGFAWVTVYGVRGNTKEGKALKEAGFSPAYTGGLQLWNPAKSGTQSISALEAGADAFVEYFRARFPDTEIYTGSRMD